MKGAFLALVVLFSMALGWYLRGPYQITVVQTRAAPQPPSWSATFRNGTQVERVVEIRGRDDSVNEVMSSELARAQEASSQKDERIEGLKERIVELKERAREMQAQVAWYRERDR